MNKYEQRAAQERKAALRSSMKIWTAGAALIVVAVAILVLSSSAYVSILLEIGDTRCNFAACVATGKPALPKHKRPRAAEPDPQSKLKLD